MCNPPFPPLLGLSVCLSVFLHTQPHRRITTEKDAPKMDILYPFITTLTHAHTLSHRTPDKRGTDNTQLQSYCNRLQHTATTKQSTSATQLCAAFPMPLSSFLVQLNTLQHNVTYCDILQHTAIHSNTHYTISPPHMCPSRPITTHGIFS